MTRLGLLVAVLLTAAALAKGPRAFVEAMDDFAARLRVQAERLDMGWDS